MSEKNAKLMGPILLEKAQQFANELDIPDFEANLGWLHRWKKNQNNRFKRLHGESVFANEEAVNNFKELVSPKLLEKYALEDVFNADETGLLYKALPDRTYVSGNQTVSG
ncbi:jerky protein homolog-like [Eupeodes corollae]|uniref:jerky protein homolog-like n=1 Tax=Eupeodes corollae TaxID=290404 RepID=UPI00248F9AC8|nr:jerky protein homolog-like [Eupeodes corollae]